MTVATDLPSRPTPNPDENKIVSATDRVKSVADKTDPRFEAALQRADKEARIRALRAKKPGQGTDGRSDEPPADESPADAASDDGEAGSFSFNMTDRDAEEDR